MQNVSINTLNEYVPWRILRIYYPIHYEHSCRDFCINMLNDQNESNRLYGDIIQCIKNIHAMIK